MTDREAIDVLFNEWKCIDRNDGIHCDRKCESCDLVMDVWIIREAFNMAISALQEQEAKTQLSAEGTTFDLISRQEAIEAVEHITPSMSVCVNTDECHGMKRMQRQAVIELANLPSAQPESEERKAESAQNVPIEDLISRKAAIDAINKALDRETLLNSFVRKVAVDALKTMPSAEQIVRCKYCKYCDRGIDEDGNPFLKCLGWVYGGTQEEDFCSHAERRTDDANANT